MWRTRRDASAIKLIKSETQIGTTSSAGDHFTATFEQNEYDRRGLTKQGIIQVVFSNACVDTNEPH